MSAVSDDYNTLKSNINNRPPVKLGDDPEYVKKFKQPVTEFPEKYAIVSMIGNDDVFHNFEAFVSSKFVESYLAQKYETAVRVIANKYNQIFLGNMETKIRDLENSVIKKFDEAVITSKEQEELNKQITNVREYLMSIYNAVKFDDMLESKLVQEIVKKETNEDYRVIEGVYIGFRDKHLNQLEQDFRKIEDYNGPIMDAFKIRGIHETIESATEHARELHSLEPYVDTFIANVGKWALWTAARDRVNDVVYMDESLSKVMSRFKKNVIEENNEFDKRYKNSLKANKVVRHDEIRERVKKDLQYKKPTNNDN